MRYSELNKAGFYIEELIMEVKSLNALDLDSEESALKITEHNFNTEHIDSSNFYSERHYTLYHKGEIVLYMVSLEVLEGYFIWLESVGGVF